MYVLRFVTLLCMLCTWTSTTMSHELWLEPREFMIEANQLIEADIRVGQDFKGSPLSFSPNGFERFDIASENDLAPITGRLGDVPAVSTEPLSEGLNILVYQPVNAVLTYSEWTKFLAFVDHKNFTDARSEHTTRDLPKTGFKEVYSRYAKSLVAVADGNGSDRAFGLETEIIALANPYTDNLEGGLSIQVLYQNAPRVGAQVEIFDRAPNGEIMVTTVQTDDRGIARIDVQAGHTYMLDAVVLREPSPELSAETEAVWESLWANLTFAVPEAM